MTKDSDSRSGRFIDHRRRQFIAALGAGGIAVLAGCSGGNDGSNSGNGGDATLTTYVTRAPADVTWGDISDWPVNVRALCTDVAATTEEDDTLIPMVVEDWESSADEIRFKVRDDANWSNGEPVLARDYLANLIVSRFTSTANPTLKEMQENGPDGMAEAITNVRFEEDGKVGYLVSEGGWFDQYNVEDWLHGQLSGDWGEIHYNEYNEGTMGIAAKEIVETVDEPVSADGREEVIAIAEEILPGEEESHPSEPEAGLDLVTAGAWQLDEVREDGISLVPNEHHYNADIINWENVELNIHPDANARWTSLNEGIIDIDNGLNESPPPNIIRSFPDHVQNHAYGANTETLLFMPATQPHLGNGRVRQAFAYAIDSEQLAQVQHEFAASMLSEPAGLTRSGIYEWIDDDLASAFQTYGYDTDRAAALLEGEGFTQEEGTWITPDGNEWSLALITRAGDSQSVEQGIVENLNDFGIQVDMEPLEDTMFEDRYHGGEFNLALEERDWSWSIYMKAFSEEARRYKMGFWENDRIVEYAEENDHINRNDYSWTHLLNGYQEEDTQRFTVSAPPVGEPDADPTEEYPVATMAGSLSDSLDEETRREYMQTLAWVWNWRLPAIPLTQIASLAFMNHRNWSAPEDDAEWELGYPDPFTNLMNMGEIQIDLNDS